MHSWNNYCHYYDMLLSTVRMWQAYHTVLEYIYSSSFNEIKTYHWITSSVVPQEKSPALSFLCFKIWLWLYFSIIKRILTLVSNWLIRKPNMLAYWKNRFSDHCTENIQEVFVCTWHYILWPNNVPYDCSLYPAAIPHDKQKYLSIQKHWFSWWSRIQTDNSIKTMYSSLPVVCNCS